MYACFVFHVIIHRIEYSGGYEFLNEHHISSVPDSVTPPLPLSERTNDRTMV